MFEILRRGRQARTFECSENSRSLIVFQIDIFRKLTLGAPGCVECLIKQWFYKEKLRMQKWAFFHLISKHSWNINFLCISFMNYWWVWEVWSRCKWTVGFFCVDCAQFPIFAWDRLDIHVPRLTVTGTLIFKCTEGAGVGDYSSGAGGGGKGEKNRGTVIISLQLAFTERVVPETEGFDMVIRQ